MQEEEARHEADEDEADEADAEDATTPPDPACYSDLEEQEKIPPEDPSPRMGRTRRNTRNIPGRLMGGG